MSFERIRYRFGLFEVDVHAGVLLRQGRRLRLQAQPFQVLVALLEQRGDLVLREQLRARLWPSDTFVEFDKSLGVALAKVRAALGDDAANPRFIETVPKRGYRFIAPITVDSDNAGVHAALEPAAPFTAPPAPSAVDARPRYRAAIAASVFLLIVGLGGFWFWRFRVDGRLTTRARVVVAAITNSTGDTAFDGSLRTVAMMGLAQSPYLHVLSDSALGQILQGLGRPPDEPLTSGLAREACRRANAAAIVDGSIARSGRGYVLTVQASRCADAGVLAQKRASVESRDQIVATLGREVADLRRELGEPTATLQSYNTPVELATTDSPEALRAYQLGMDLRARADNLKAIPALKTAIALDPQFAVAYAQLGSSCTPTWATPTRAHLFFARRSSCATGRPRRNGSSSPDAISTS